MNAGHAPHGPETPPLCGVLVIDKPLGYTSMDVCAKIRNKFRRGGVPKGIKVGHGGTLDPLATGVLVVLVGRATRMCNRVMEGDKEYEAEIDLAHTSATHDRESPFIPAAVASIPDAEAVRQALGRFVGVVRQLPPAHSAMMVGGVRAYMLARSGEHVPLEARPVMIHSITPLDYAWPLLRIGVRCGKGTYIRSLARDIGAALNTGGTLTALRRTLAAPFDLSRARDLEAMPEALRPEDLDPLPDDIN